jgi:FtsP/CotA-like multicopper oxidase with cupredoxin domain
MARQRGTSSIWHMEQPDAATRSPFILPRRSILRGAAYTTAGLVAGTVASACAGVRPGWTAGPGTAPPVALAAASASPSATEAAQHGSAPASPAASAMPSHDDAAQAVVTRFLEGEWQQVPGYGNQPLAPTIDGDTKVFDISISPIVHMLSATLDPIDALGFNGTWPGPQLRVTEGDKVRAVFTNNMDESTGIHFHGQELPNAMDGVPFVTQPPIMPGERFTYEFTAKPAGTHMYHSHHNATDQVGRGLLGAFLVDPADPAQRYDAKYGATQDIVWISNDAFGGFTINGRQFPATAPIVAKQDEQIVIRFMNEGVMMHPWHLHGMPMRVVARDGYPLGSAEFTCDTLGVNPGERWDVVIDCRNPGAWAFHCHILPHAEGSNGMFGMVTALVVQA